MITDIAQVSPTGYYLRLPFPHVNLKHAQSRGKSTQLQLVHIYQTPVHNKGPHKDPNKIENNKDFNEEKCGARVTTGIIKQELISMSCLSSGTGCTKPSWTAYLVDRSVQLIQEEFKNCLLKCFKLAFKDKTCIL